MEDEVSRYRKNLRDDKVGDGHGYDPGTLTIPGLVTTSIYFTRDYYGISMAMARISQVWRFFHSLSDPTSEYERGAGIAQDRLAGMANSTMEVRVWFKNVSLPQWAVYRHGNTGDTLSERQVTHTVGGPQNRKYRVEGKFPRVHRDGRFRQCGHIRKLTGTFLGFSPGDGF